MKSKTQRVKTRSADKNIQTPAEPTQAVASTRVISTFQNAALTSASYLLVLAVALACFVINLADPPHLFWDENYHVTSAERYIEGIAQFEPHPPLGIMLLTIGEVLAHPNQKIDKHPLIVTKQIPGDDLPKGFSFSGMRLMPSLFGALGALCFFGLMYELLEQRIAALALTSFYVFENAFIVHFRAAHLDGFQMFFSLAAMWHFVHLWRGSNNLRWFQYGLLALLCTFACMVKMNAIVLFLLFPILYLKDAKHKKFDAKLLTDFASKSGTALAAAAATVFVIFYIHVGISRTLPDINTAAGKQDIENMSPSYKHFLEHHEALTPGIVITAAGDYFRFMDKDHKGVPKLDSTKPGENGSHPLQWPLNYKTINYRWDSSDGKTSYVQLTGNQFSWYIGLIAVLLSLILIANHRVFAIPLSGSKETYQLIEAFTSLYAAFMLLHLWIITQRVMYLYHYFLGLTVSYVLVALMWKYLCDIHPSMKRNRYPLLGSIAGMVALSFWLFLPFTNHWPLTNKECEQRNIFSRVVVCNP